MPDARRQVRNYVFPNSASRAEKLVLPEARIQVRNYVFPNSAGREDRDYQRPEYRKGILPYSLAEKLGLPETRLQVRNPSILCWHRR